MVPHASPFYSRRFLIKLVVRRKNITPSQPIPKFEVNDWVCYITNDGCKMGKPYQTFWSGEGVRLRRLPKIRNIKVCILCGSCLGILDARRWSPAKLTFKFESIQLKRHILELSTQKRKPIAAQFRKHHRQNISDGWASGSSWRLLRTCAWGITSSQPGPGLGFFKN